MPQQDVDRNWLPSLGLVVALHVAAWWGLAHFKDDTTRPAPLPVVNVALLPPPEPPPRVATPQPEPPKPRPLPQAAPQPVPRPVETAATATPTPPAVAEESKPAQPAAPASAAAPVLAAPPPTPPVSEPLVEPPRYNAAYLSNPPPAYPLAARRRGIEGTAMVRAEISAGGECLRAELKKSSGAETLDQAALEAVKKWRFAPARRGGQAVVAWVEVPITFKLEN